MKLLVLTALVLASAPFGASQDLQETAPTFVTEDGKLQIEAERITLKADVVECDGECFPSLVNHIDTVSNAVQKLVDDGIGNLQGDLADVSVALDVANGLAGVTSTVVDSLSSALPNLQETSDKMNDTLNGLTYLPNTVFDMEKRLLTLEDTAASLETAMSGIKKCLACGAQSYCKEGECTPCSAPCPPGYKEGTSCGYDHDRVCEDMDECAHPSDNNCSPNAQCSNTDGGFSCVCKEGFFGDGSTCSPCTKSCTGGYSVVTACTTDHDLVCEDTNECNEKTHKCHDEHATCINEDGGYRCECNTGYYGDGIFCRKCTAECPAGFEQGEPCSGPHDLGCKDVDECATKPCPTGEVCRNIPGRYLCDCPVGQRRVDGSCITSLGAESWVGHVTAASANAISNSLGGTIQWEEFTNSNKDVFAVNSGLLQVKKEGHIFVTYTQDVIASSGYTYIILYKVDAQNDLEEFSRELVSKTDGYWDGIHVSGVTYVQPNDRIRAAIVGTSDGIIQKIDPGNWARVSAIWTPPHEGAGHFRGQLKNKASSNRPAFALVSNKNMDGLMTLTDGDTQVRFDRPGVVLFSYHQDIRHNCGYLWGQAVINHDRSGATVISRELISNTRGLIDGWQVGGFASVDANDKLYFDFTLCGSHGLDNGAWGPLSVSFYPRGSAATLLGYTRNAVVADGRSFSFSSQSQSDSSSLTFDTFGRIKALASGHMGVSFHQDVIHGCGYATVNIYVLKADGSEVLTKRELTSNTHRKWDGISIMGFIDVDAGDIVDLRMSQCTASSMDNGVWGSLSVALFF